MIRKANFEDIPAIVASYDELLKFEAENTSYSRWAAGVYPTAKVPEGKVPLGTMYVLEENGEICASMVMDHVQPFYYEDVEWQYEADPERVMVIHTLCVPPSKAGHGYGTQMVEFVKKQAAAADCISIRMDTHVDNKPAQALYAKLGFATRGRLDDLITQGVLKASLYFLEYKIKK